MGRESNASIAHFFNRDCVCYHLRTFNLGVLPFRHDGRRPIWQAKPNAVPPWSLHRRFLVSLSPPGSPQPRALSLNFSPCLFYLASARRATNGSNRYSEAGEEARPALPPYPLTHDHDPPHRTPRSPPHSLHHQSTTALLPRRPEQNTEWPRPAPARDRTSHGLPAQRYTPPAFLASFYRFRVLFAVAYCACAYLVTTASAAIPRSSRFSSCFPLVRGRRPGRLLSEG